MIAVDLGATSVRVCRVDLDGRPPSLHVVHRYAHGPVTGADGSLRWDWQRLVAEIERGLTAALDAGPVASIGVDGWGVDYGLLRADGSLVSAPYSYRDGRTSEWSSVIDSIGEDELYRIAGIQPMPINTIFQLAAHTRAELAAAERLALIPELMVHALTGADAVAEPSSASTTGLVDLATGTWSEILLGTIDVDPSLLPPLVPATTAIGAWRGVPVHLVGGHDTASAVAALPGPPQPGAVFASTGTWIIAGCERDEPDTSAGARTARFSNERGALGGVRFLKNINGTWLIEQCRAAFGQMPVPALVALAASSPPAGDHVFDATDRRFLAPPDMRAEVCAAAGLPASAAPGVVVRSILESLAWSLAAVVDELATLRGVPASEIHVLGGASQIQVLNDLIEDACGLPVRTSPSGVEATALGNALVQGVAVGRFASLNEARAIL